MFKGLQHKPRQTTWTNSCSCYCNLEYFPHFCCLCWFVFSVAIFHITPHSSNPPGIRRGCQLSLLRIANFPTRINLIYDRWPVIIKIKTKINLRKLLKQFQLCVMSLVKFVTTLDFWKVSCHPLTNMGMTYCNGNTIIFLQWFLNNFYFLRTLKLLKVCPN